LQNNVTPNNTPLQPLNGDSPVLPDSVPSTPGSRKRPSDTPVVNPRKKAKTAEENLNQVCSEVEEVWVGRVADSVSLNSSKCSSEIPTHVFMDIE
jgi:hypothetical protein